MKKVSQLMATLIIVLLILRGMEIAKACNPLELAPCKASIENGSKPTNICCLALKNQSKECMCSYYKDPTTAKYFKSPNTRKVGDACGVKHHDDC